MASPKNYSQMLSKLWKWTFFTTVVFLIGLKFLELIPKIEVSEELIPPIKDHQQLIEWCLSFGAIPFIGAVAACVLSSVFEIHNKLSKIILIRFVWDKLFIVRPMLKKVGMYQKLNRSKVEEIMSGLYYPEVKNIDQHYVHVFWRYALHFWVLFEHLLVVIATVIILWIIKGSMPHVGLLLYLLSVFFVTAFHWFFVVTKKSKDQAKQIPDHKIRSFLRP